MEACETPLTRLGPRPVEGRINPVVDFYNTLSLRHVCRAGAFDLERLDDVIRRQTRAVSLASRPVVA
jgi:hypothetical protein